eukprot:scaffold20136_cov44-Attheya_sp.AAC.2
MPNVWRRLLPRGGARRSAQEDVWTAAQAAIMIRVNMAQDESVRDALNAFTVIVPIIGGAIAIGFIANSVV